MNVYLLFIHQNFGNSIFHVHDSDLVYPSIQNTRSSSLKWDLFDQLDKSLENLPLETHSKGPKRLAGGMSLALTCKS